MLIVRIDGCVHSDEYRRTSVFTGIASYREVLSKRRALLRYIELTSICDAGVFEGLNTRLCMVAFSRSAKSKQPFAVFGLSVNGQGIHMQLF